MLIGIDEVKIAQVISYLSDRYNKIHKDVHGINIISILKLMFLANRYSLRDRSKRVVNDTFYAMEKGPVASKAYDILKGSDFEFVDEELKQDFKNTLIYFGNNVYTNSSLKEYDYLSKYDIKVLDLIIKTFGKLSENELVELTHKYPEWTAYKKELTNNKRIQIDIDKFFENCVDDKLNGFMSLKDLQNKKEYFLSKF